MPYITPTMIAATPSDIEAQECADGAAFRAADTLPIQCHFCTREQLEAMGIVFGEPADDLFVHVQLPRGWNKIDDGHRYGYWTTLRDEKGRERAAIFYKTALHDRCAHISLTKRFRIDQFHPCDEAGRPGETERPSHFMVTIKDGDAIIHTLGFVQAHKYTGILDLLGAAIVWLDAHYPDWENPLAYWDL